MPGNLLHQKYCEMFLSKTQKREREGRIRQEEGGLKRLSLFKIYIYVYVTEIH